MKNKPTIPNSRVIELRKQWQSERNERKGNNGSNAKRDFDALFKPSSNKLGVIDYAGKNRA